MLFFLISISTVSLILSDPASREALRGYSGISLSLSFRAPYQIVLMRLIFAPGNRDRSDKPVSRGFPSPASASHDRITAFLLASCRARCLASRKNELWAADAAVASSVGRCQEVSLGRPGGPGASALALGSKRACRQRDTCQHRLLIQKSASGPRARPKGMLARREEHRGIDGHFSELSVR